MREMRSYFIAGTLLLLLYLTAQYYKPRPTDWTPTYDNEDKIPFGLYILSHEMTSLFPHSDVQRTSTRIYNTLNNKKISQANYMFIAGSVKMDALDYRELLKFIRKGNHVLIAAYEIQNLLQDSLGLTVGLDGNNTVNVHFANPTLDTAITYTFDRGTASQYFSKFDTLKATVIGKNENGQANFLKYTFGRGSLLIMPNPQLFTNYSMLQTKGADYVATALSYLPPAKTLLLDEYNTHPPEQNTSLMRVVFDHPPLRRAYEIAIFSVLIFVCFEIKRRQRIIPVIPPLTNTSVDFVKVVGQVYYQERDNTDISHKKIAYFLDFIRQKYRLKTHELNLELQENLAARSGLSSQEIQQLFAAMAAIQQTKKVNDQQLIDINQRIEQFYEQTR